MRPQQCYHSYVPIWIKHSAKVLNIFLKLLKKFWNYIWNPILSTWNLYSHNLVNFVFFSWKIFIKVLLLEITFYVN